MQPGEPKCLRVGLARHLEPRAVSHSSPLSQSLLEPWVFWESWISTSLHKRLFKIPLCDCLHHFILCQFCQAARHHHTGRRAELITVGGVGEFFKSGAWPPLQRCWSASGEKWYFLRRFKVSWQRYASTWLQLHLLFLHLPGGRENRRQQDPCVCVHGSWWEVGDPWDKESLRLQPHNCALRWKSTKFRKNSTWSHETDKGTSKQPRMIVWKLHSNSSDIRWYPMTSRHPHGLLQSSPDFERCYGDALVTFAQVKSVEQAAGSLE